MKINPFADSREKYESDGYIIGRGVIVNDLIESVRKQIISVFEILDPGISTISAADIDRAWFALNEKYGRSSGALIYNAAKHLPGIYALASDESLLTKVKSLLGSSSIAIVDVNFRIDAPDEDQYLFSWHQDYWFSVCSPRSIVAWIPLCNLDQTIGGVEVIPLSQTKGKIFNVRRSSEYNSYSNSIILDEDVDAKNAIQPNLKICDALFFRFDVLHRSLPNRSKNRCRWTLQLRFSDFCDFEFRNRQFKPGIVSKNEISYLDQEIRKNEQ